MNYVQSFGNARQTINTLMTLSKFEYILTMMPVLLNTLRSSAVPTTYSRSNATE